jgi:hypothetical protein
MKRNPKISESLWLLALPFMCILYSACESPKKDTRQIRGVVSSTEGPEAGVWVIAETKDLPTRYAKIVVTNDEGEYLIPDLPDAEYDVWVRGYGLVDSRKRKAKPGANLDLEARIAPDPKDAAYYYPAGYWFSLLEAPGKENFPGTGPDGNGVSLMFSIGRIF